MEKLLKVSSSPHVRDGVTTQRLMFDVVIAMIPASVYGVWQFGMNALLVLIATVIASVAAEYLYEKLMHKPITISDGSAVVTGMILALNMPPEIPVWIPVLGAFFAIIVVKQLYGCLLYTSHWAVWSLDFQIPSVPVSRHMAFHPSSF